MQTQSICTRSFTAARPSAFRHLVLPAAFLSTTRSAPAGPTVPNPVASSPAAVPQSGARPGYISPAPASTRNSTAATSTAAAMSESPTYRLARALKRRAPGMVDTYVAYSATADMAKRCWTQADYRIAPEAAADGMIAKTESGEDLGEGDGWWFTEAGLKPTFAAWSQVSMLHMYIIIVRLRMFPVDSTHTWHQHLLDHFFHEAERRMEELHGLTKRSVQQHYLKDLYTQWRGILAAYDEGFIKGDAVLAAAVWRNVFKAEPGQSVDAVVLAQIVAHSRRQIAMLDQLDDDQFASGDWQFGSIEDERNGVLAKSRLLN